MQVYLYTGPSFERWNGVLRCMTRSELLKDRADRPQNLYSTSIQVLSSATLKLSQLTKIPLGRKVYRGQGKMYLGEEWHKSNERGVRSGVELGFLSTTLDQHIALEYSGVKRGTGTLLEIEVGAIDCGGQLDTLSQYPGEGELLITPLSHIELVGEPETRMHEWDGKQGKVVVFRVKINNNQKSATIEQVLKA